MSSGAFLIRFLLGLAASIGALSLLLGCVFSSPRAEGHVLAAVAQGGAPIEARISRVAGALAGKRVAVRCWSSSEWPQLTRQESLYANDKLNSATLGFADIGGTQINLSPTVCNGLVELVDGDARPSGEVDRLGLASALVTLAHEPQHSKGISKEAVAECYAIQLAPQAARRLGVGRGYAASLLQTYWRHYSSELPDYQSPDCRRGGALDLHRADSIWP